MPSAIRAVVCYALRTRPTKKTGCRDKEQVVLEITVLTAHFSDKAHERLVQYETLIKRCTSFIGRGITLCDHNSLLFPNVEAHSPPCQESSAMLKAKDAKSRCPQPTSLSDPWNHVHLHEI